MLIDNLSKAAGYLLKRVGRELGCMFDLNPKEHYMGNESSRRGPGDDWEW